MGDMVLMNGCNVVVATERYEELLGAERTFELFKAMLLDTAELSWNNKDLRFDDELLNTLLKMESPYSWNSKLNKLRIEKGLGAESPDTVTITVKENEQN